MAKGLMKMEEVKKAIIKTKPFYRKFSGMISLDSECLVTQETENAYLIREKTGKELDFSLTSMWIGKSKIISIEFVRKFDYEIREEYDRANALIPLKFSYEEYRAVVLKNSEKLNEGK